jgi:FolB domain-containing protein
MSNITIKGLTIPVIIGTKPKERTTKQKIQIDLCFSYNASKAMKSDCLDQAVDYHALANHVVAETQKTKFFLIERLADFITELVFKTDSRISRVTITIDKFSTIARAGSVQFQHNKKRTKKNTGNT